MLTTRTTARGLLVLALLGLLAGTAAARPDPPGRWIPKPAPRAKPAGKQIVFPVLGRSQLTNSFGDPRPQGMHEGEDIMAPRRALALAAEAGKVRFQTGARSWGCMLYLDGQSGTTYVYIHLNNDLTMQNDNRGGCVNGVAFPRGLKPGQRVQAGQPVGFVGDSGDANGISPHLHFEVRPGGGGAIDPYPQLRAAKRLLFYAPAGTIFTLGLSGKVVATAGESLRVQVNGLNAFPMRIKLHNLGRTLTVTVPGSALVERRQKPGEPGIAAVLASAKKGESVTVWTEPAAATSDAQAGMDGVLVAERVLLPAAS